MAATAYGSLPFDEQIEFFRAKHPVLTRAWTDVYAAEHEHAFMVAGAAKADLLSDLLAAIDQVVADGGTLAQFRKDFDDIVERHGWQYKGGRNWRTRVIYETNLRQSYNAGREAQMADPDLRRRRPYGLYRHGRSEHPRPEHLAWDGTVLPLDDPWWETHTPQNGWGCKCRKLMVSAADVERMGLQVAGQAPPVVWEEKIVGAKGPSPRTVKVPRGIDPGFEYRPGRTRATAVMARVGQWPPPIAAAFAGGMRAGAREAVAVEYDRWIDGVLADPTPRGRVVTLWAMEPAELAFLQKADRLPQRADISIEDRIVAGKKAERHEAAGTALTENQWRALARMAPEAVLYDNIDGRLLYVLPVADRKIKVVVAPDFWDKKQKATVNSVRTVFTTEALALKDRTRYTVIRGRVK
jgi:hypothetical protein